MDKAYLTKRPPDQMTTWKGVALLDVFINQPLHGGKIQKADFYAKQENNLALYIICFRYRRLRPFLRYRNSCCPVSPLDGGLDVLTIGQRCR